LDEKLTVQQMRSPKDFGEAGQARQASEDVKMTNGLRIETPPGALVAIKQWIDPT
jgi:hypothetical protein